jgi:hypothetical protein
MNRILMHILYEELNYLDWYSTILKPLRGIKSLLVIDLPGKKGQRVSVNGISMYSLVTFSFIYQREQKGS